MLPARLNSIRGKLLFIVMVTTTFALLISAVSMAVLELRNFRNTWVNDLSTQADVVGLAAAPALQFSDPEAAHDYLALLRAKPGITSAAIYTASGGLFASYSASGESVSFPELPDVDGHYVNEDELVLFKRIVAGGEIVGTVGLRAQYDLAARLFDYIGILGIIMAVSLAGAGLVTGRLQRTITGPLSDVTSVARTVMEKKDYSLRAPATTDDEIGVLVDAFNDMLDELGRRAEVLEKSEDQLRNLNIELEDRVAARTSALEAANGELESFSYSVSHDLRAPLRAITGFSNLLWMDHKEHLDEEAQRKLGIIRSEADRMGMLIDDLLAFSRLGRKSMEPTELNMAELVNNAFRRLAQNEEDTLQFQLGRLPPAIADRSLMEQVWSNLLSNAIKFSSHEENPVIEVGAIVTETENVYFVRDNGAGFDPRYSDKLFGVFQRLHDASEFPGTGVGLALVQRIVNRHGGRVWADGQPGDGATFHFSLPRETHDG